MDKGMHKLRESLPRDSRLLAIIHENDQLKRQTEETLFSGPITTNNTGTSGSLLDDASAEDPQLELIQSHLNLDDDNKQE
jgi:hypothetical protein